MQGAIRTLAQSILKTLVSGPNIIPILQMEKLSLNPACLRSHSWCWKNLNLVLGLSDSRTFPLTARSSEVKGLPLGLHKSSSETEVGGLHLMHTPAKKRIAGSHSYKLSFTEDDKH